MDTREGGKKARDCEIIREHIVLYGAQLVNLVIRILMVNIREEAR